jgi:hypothetical protein
MRIRTHAARFLARCAHGDTRSALAATWALSCVARAPACADAAVAHALQTVFHYGFIPLIIVLGMRTEPRPSLAQLLGPM